MSLPAGAVNGLAPALAPGSAVISLAPFTPAVVFALDPPPQALRAVAAASARTHAASLSDWDSHRSRCPAIREDPLRRDGPRQAPPRVQAVSRRRSAARPSVPLEARDRARRTWRRTPCRDTLEVVPCVRPEQRQVDQQ